MTYIIYIYEYRNGIAVHTSFRGSVFACISKFWIQILNSSRLIVIVNVVYLQIFSCRSLLYIFLQRYWHLYWNLRFCNTFLYCIYFHNTIHNNYPYFLYMTELFIFFSLTHWILNLFDCIFTKINSYLSIFKYLQIIVFINR